MRKEGWESILAAEIKAARNKPFQWGTHDCVLWANSVVEAITGQDYLAEFRGRYKSQTGAHRLIKTVAPSLPQAVDLHFERIPVAKAGRGDLVYFEKALGVCDGMHSFFITPDRGIAGIGTLKCEIAWRVI